ncbi:MAG: 3-oxoacyl-ACP reductase FabG [Actinomycetota bacterium]|nr:3-oxoacyl-ACP reductase FabG [Actinomycetota bacterium]
MTEPTGRVALVTGGTRGIGLACARALADDGHVVAVGSRSQPADLDPRLTWVPCDVTSAESIDQAFTRVEAELGPVTILVANAGITQDTLVLRMSDDAFDKVVDANLGGAFRCAKRAVKSMMKARWGRIVLMSSVVGSTGQTGQANYAASKAGLVGLGRSLAREFASRNITVNLVAPGPIETDMLDAVGDDTKAAIVATVPLGRIGTPDDVAAAVRFLVSEGAGYVTGATIPVDGGLGMGA